ncbi:CLN3 protein [Teladorsagia circumcincta]|uniref:Battenin n=1 Tax=Teladorsagia circumcincta TaxID=45464 RepID=A0A2G9V1A0_TELCI|nr:CLN3 protein [Teladorsagia circumcincta]
MCKNKGDLVASECPQLATFGIESRLIFDQADENCYQHGVVRKSCRKNQKLNENSNETKIPNGTDMLCVAKGTARQLLNAFLCFDLLFGLCNNYGYVIMLSAAEDIMHVQKGENQTESLDQCEDRISDRHCTPMSTGAVLLANNLPNLFVVFTFPFFMHRIPYMVAIAAWSSGTGGAGLIGSFSYAFLTEQSMANLKPKVALLLQLLVPVVFVLTYLCILVIPDDVHTPGLHPITWIVPKEVTSKNEEEEGYSDTAEGDSHTSEALNSGSSNVKVPQRHLTFIEKIKHIPVRDICFVLWKLTNDYLRILK